VKIEAEKEMPKKNAEDVMRITNVTDPMITVFKPEKPNGTAVLVCPGGGYGILAYEHEGSQVCDFLNQHGVTGILLKYRVPKRDPNDPGREALQDAQRAMGIIRHRAAEWGSQAGPHRHSRLFRRWSSHGDDHAACERAHLHDRSCARCR
jgi:acetyl esterase/lipase